MVTQWWYGIHDAPEPFPRKKLVFAVFDKVVDFGTNRKRVYDFLLVINSNIGPILHRFGDMVVYWSKNRQNRQFAPTPVSQIALARGDLYRISG